MHFRKMPMKLLAIETATEACSAALWIDGSIDERFEIAPRRHTELILPMIDTLLAAAGVKVTHLDALAIGCGPGAFTGVRIAAGVAQGLALAADRPIVAVSTLAALAQTQAQTATHVLAALDARMEEIYWGCYERDDRNCMRLLNEEWVGRPESTPVPPTGNWCGVGSGWDRYAHALYERLNTLSVNVIHEVWPRASAILPIAVEDFRAGRATEPGQLRPTYLRNRVVNT